MSLRSLVSVALGVSLALVFWLGRPVAGWGEPPDHLSTRVERGQGGEVPGQESGRFIPGVVLVKFKEGPGGGRAEGSLRAQGLPVEETLPQIRVKRVRVAPGKEMEEVARLRANPDVEYATLDYEIRLFRTPDDPSYPSQWNLARINAPGAWDITTGSESVIIAVADTGVKLSHPDLAGKIIPGLNVITPTDSPDDDHGHGTHVAGIAAGGSNNGIGVAGVSWGARIMPVKVMRNDGRGSTSSLLEGMLWAVDHGARVLNLSLGTDEADQGLIQIMCDSVSHAQSRGALVVAAAGNTGKSNPVYPAACDGALAVTATGSTDSFASFSSFGPHVDVAAPGIGILSTLPASDTPMSDPSGYRAWNGTSMAAPHVAGLAALIWSVNPALSPAEVAQIIRQTAVDLGDPGKDDRFGYGRIDAAAAVNAALGATSVAVEATPSRLRFLADPSVPPAPQLLNVRALSSAQDAALAWQATTSQSWLRVNGGSSVAGQTPDSLTVSVNPSGLISGTVVAGSVRVVVEGAQNSPLDVPVTFKYTSTPLHRLYLPGAAKGSGGGW